MNKSIYDIQEEEVAIFREQLDNLKRIEEDLERNIQEAKLRKFLYAEIQVRKIESPESIFAPTIDLIDQNITQFKKELETIKEQIHNHYKHIDALVKVGNYL